MVHFMIYLLETGICLSLLYLAYWLFLRKETYFNFNRIFLVGSIALSLLVPLLHVTVLVPRGSNLEQTTSGIEKVRDSYEEMIRMINADYGTEPGARHSANGLESGLASAAGEVGSVVTEADQVLSSKHNMSFSKVLLILYICGVVWFLARFIYLVVRLYLLAKRNRVSQQDGFRMVEIEEQISPFSFFRFLFITNGSFNEPEFFQVLEHEKAHIRQRHSMDHLFAHGLAVFQWFNPIAWQIRKALKTTHEYIADRQVLDRGVERQDYQSLLLRQVIGYHSVELVNNFNLKPIKKRIIMMNKNKSGISARFKASLVAPFAILIFFLFADFTLKGSSAAGDSIKELEGLWIKQSKDDFSDKIFIKDGSFSYINGDEILQYNALLQDGVILLKDMGIQWPIRYKLSENVLSFSWDRNTTSRYIKSQAKNTLDQLLTENHMKIDLPHISRYRLMEKEDLIYRIGIGKEKDGTIFYTFNGGSISLAELSGLVKKKKAKLSVPDKSKMTGIFYVDRKVPMSEVDKVRLELRKNSLRIVAEGGYPNGDLELSPLLYHTVALPRLLPPMDAKKLVIKNEWVKGATVTAKAPPTTESEPFKDSTPLVYTIDLSARNTTPREVDKNLKEFISSSPNGKYVVSLEYDKDIPYGQYVETVDMIYNVVYSFRGVLAEEKYGAPYDQLGAELQKEIRKVYPIALSETMK